MFHMSPCDSRHSPSPPRGVCSPVQTVAGEHRQQKLGTKRWLEETNLLLPGSALGGRGSNTSRSQGEMCVRYTTSGSAWEQPCLWSRIRGHPFPLHCRKTHSIKTSGYWAGIGTCWTFTIFSSRGACARLVAGGCHSSRAGCASTWLCPGAGGSTRQLLAKTGQGGHKGECGSSPVFPHGFCHSW